MLKKLLVAALLGFQALVVAAPQAQATVPEWSVIRLQDKAEGYANCRQSPDGKSRVVATFREGTAVEAQYYNGTFTQIFQSSSFVPGARKARCYVSAPLVKPLNTDSVKGIIYGGSYKMTEGFGIRCRKYPGLEAPSVRNISKGTALTISTIGLDTTNQTWGRTQFGCYVIGEPLYLQWTGQGENPNSACHYMKEGC